MALAGAFTGRASPSSSCRFPKGSVLSRAQTALPFSLSRAEGGIIGPITGWLIDRFGVKPLMFFGTIINRLRLPVAVADEQLPRLPVRVPVRRFARFVNWVHAGDYIRAEHMVHQASRPW